MKLTPQDQQLVEAATETIKKYLAVGKHKVATAMVTTNGQVITGINIEGSFGCIDVCAEQVTLGKALSEGSTDVECIVSVKHPKPGDIDQNIKVISPCGKCRELLYDYVPNAWILVRDGQTIQKVKVRDLLPFRYSKV